MRAGSIPSVGAAQLLPFIAAGCPAASDQALHTAFVRELNTGPVTVPGVHNVLLLSICPTDNSTHTKLAYSATTWQLVQSALDPARPVPSGCAHF